MSSPGGKGHARRPTDEAAYSAGYDAIFGRKADQALADGMRAENLRQARGDEVTDAMRAATYTRANMGCSSTAEQGALTASVVGSNPTAPAIYVDNASG